MGSPFNPSVSVDCVVFGFDGTALRILLVKRNTEKENTIVPDHKLPGSLIRQDEDLRSAAYRVLEEMTGIRNIYLKQLHVFSDPDRIVGQELSWLQEYYKVKTDRVITVAYYSLLKLNKGIELHTRRKRAVWIDVQQVCHLALDHKKILMEALSTLSRELIHSPIAFELLPRKFTIRQLQSLYEGILGIEIDNRNFRKKIFSQGYLVPSTEYEANVAHKPARYYTFNKTAYEKELRRKFRQGFIRWHE